MSNGKLTDCEAVVLGAGPYGLSAASHLKATGVDVRVFGKPMDFWADKMPAGMLLRSPRVASNISDPDRRTTLDAYESSAVVPARAPVALETFVDYGRWFQRQLLPDLDQREIVAVNRNERGFSVALRDGEQFHSKNVVIAAGIGPFLRIPSEFASLPSSQLSHCYQGCNPKGFLKRRVAVIGAGQSALECAALLHEAGAEVEVIARISELRWIGQHPWLHRLGPISSMLYSSHDVGPAGISRMVAAPKLMTQVPLQLRDKIRKRAVRPAGSQWLKARIKNISISTGRLVAAAKAVGTEVELKLDDGSRRVVDHVLLGTGYAVDVVKYKFLSPELVSRLDLQDGYPILKAGFASSVPGLHFIGATAARTFGPLLYFVAGTEFTSKELTSHFRRERSR